MKEGVPKVMGHPSALPYIRIEYKEAYGILFVAKQPLSQSPISEVPPFHRAHQLVLHRLFPVSKLPPFSHGGHPSLSP